MKIQKILNVSLLLLLLTVTLVWASEKLFTKLVEEFYPPVIKDFIGYVNKGERYPLIHAIYDLRVRVFQKKLGINKAEETKACSDRRNFGKEVPEDQQVFCSRYDELIDLARAQVAISKVFEPLYLNYEPELLREIEKQKARDAVRIWIRQKLNCLDDHFRCGRDERGMLERVTGFQEETLETYRMLLVNLDKKLFPEEQTLPPVQAMDLETQCDFVQKGKTYNIKQGMVYIEGGPFTMGSEEGPDNEIPKREVHVDGFWIDRCEVTNYQYLLYLGRDPFLRKSTFPRKFHDGNYLKNWMDDLMPPMGEELNPVVYVSWYAARYYCNALGKRLPSEAEWEKVARDQTEGAYPFEGGADFLPDYGWFRKNSGGLMHIAAEKTPNSYGVYDTLGNAWEWVFDRFGFYQLRNKDNPQGPKTGAYRVLRGGAWNDPADYLRPALRRDNLPQSTRFNVGFRCAADLPE